MTDTTSMTTRTPWHLWVVGGLSALWNCIGPYDFIMTTTRGETYWRESGMTQPMIDYYAAMPVWLYVPWFLGVWGAILGSILLLLRNKLAVPVFAVSLLGAIITFGYQKFVDPAPPPPPELVMMTYMPYVITVIAVFLLWYAWTMSKKGVLR